MKKYGILAAILVTTCMAGITLSRAQLETRHKDTAFLVSADVKDRIQELSSSDPAKRAAAACELGKMGARAEPAIPALITLLGDGSRVAPELVCYREYFSKANTEPEFEGLREPSPGEAAVQALISLGEPSVEPLLAALKGSQWRVRKNAAWTLGQLKDRRGLDPLIATLKDETWQVRAYSAIALGELRDKSVTEPLIVALNDVQPAVRWFAANSLGQTKDSHAVEPLIAALKDQHPRTRAFAAASLGQIRDSRTVPPLIAALKDQNSEVRMYAAASLGEQRDARAREALNVALQDESQQVRFYARTALDLLRN
jgi:HEAT repeat protein